ncbi:origin recognition complex protein subunit ORC2 [Cryptosporidium ubiquitum]|uniref:Origin recognition complex subunit 2 n=1 Tax=Cryptosporidium ubiquitum TaxID=857276 RepID=A0A1J4MCQ2_9CRYT|nr:origin recognition complex protein subunit ORC2 [Cryptosporidium ubiquitum]OII72016.1 origin recognition complex protein subunit ORC2 [Cryptosporidium ubiquitum]
MRRGFSDYLIQNNLISTLNEELPEVDLQLLKKRNVIVEKKLDKIRKAKRSNWDSTHEKMLTWSLSGFSVLLYGFGSKINFLDEFVKKKINGNYVALTIRGYFKNVKFKSCLFELLKVMENTGDLINDGIKSYINNSNSSECSIDSIITKIQLLYNNSSACFENIFLIIHNIDSLSIRPYLPAISQLSQLPFISVIVSVDNIRWPLLWNNSMRCKMNFLYLKVSTFEEYNIELDHLYESQLPPWLGILSDDSNGQCKLEQLNSILNCLTPSHIQVTNAIANLQLKYGYAAEDQLFKSLKSSMIVTTKSSLSQLLIELFTHDVLTKQSLNSKENKDGDIVYRLKLSNELIQEYLNNLL